MVAIELEELGKTEHNLGIGEQKLIKTTNLIWNSKTFWLVQDVKFVVLYGTTSSPVSGRVM